MERTTIAMDLAKSVFEVAVANERGQILELKRLGRASFRRLLATRPSSRVVMEACGTAHHWGRVAQQQGHRVTLLPPQYVRPFVRRNKTDRADAEALVDAARAERIPAVPVKRVEQQALVGLHRVREQWVTTRTARINYLRGLLREQGLPLPVGAKTAVQAIPALLEAATELPAALRRVLVSVQEVENALPPAAARPGRATAFSISLAGSRGPREPLDRRGCRKSAARARARPVTTPSPATVPDGTDQWPGRRWCVRGGVRAAARRFRQREAVRGGQPAVAGRVGLAGVPHHAWDRTSVCSLVRQLRGPHLSTCAWWRRRSRSAVTAAVSPRSFPQSSTGRFEVSSVDARSYRRMMISSRSSAAVWGSLRMPRSSMMSSGTTVSSARYALRVSASVASASSSSNVWASRYRTR